MFWGMSIGPDVDVYQSIHDLWDGCRHGTFNFGKVGNVDGMVKWRQHSWLSCGLWVWAAFCPVLALRWL